LKIIILPGLEKIDKNVSSYQYITSFDNWMKENFSINAKMARFYYPLLFLFVVLGLGFSNNFQEIFTELIGSPNEFYSLFGVPMFLLLPIVSATVLLALFGAKLYRLDLNMVYGGVLKKLEEIIADMEELRD